MVTTLKQEIFATINSISLFYNILTWVTSREAVSVSNKKRLEGMLMSVYVQSLQFQKKMSGNF